MILTTTDHSTIIFSAYRSSVARRNSSDILRLPLEQTSLHWLQKIHWVTQIRTRLVSGRNSIALAGQTLIHILHPIQVSRSYRIFPLNLGGVCTGGLIDAVPPATALRYAVIEGGRFFAGKRLVAGFLKSWRRTMETAGSRIMISTLRRQASRPQ